MQSQEYCFAARDGVATESMMKSATLKRPRRLRDRIAPTTIVVGRRLDATSAKRFGRSIAKLVAAGARECIIDMSEVEALDSSGFGSLIAAFRKMEEVGGSVIVVCNNPTICRLFEIAGISRIVPVVTTIAAARAALKRRPQRALAS